MGTEIRKGETTWSMYVDGVLVASWFDNGQPPTLHTSDAMAIARGFAYLIEVPDGDEGRLDTVEALLAHKGLNGRGE